MLGLTWNHVSINGPIVYFKRPELVLEDRKNICDFCHFSPLRYRRLLHSLLVGNDDPFILYRPCRLQSQVISSCGMGLVCWEYYDLRTWGGGYLANILHSVIFAFFNIAKTHISCWISHLYLTGVAAVQLRWHLSIVNVNHII